MTKALIIAIASIALFTINITSQEVALQRQKRTLLWPDGTAKIQLIIGFGIPVDLKEKGKSLILGLVIKANYATPTNVSQLFYPGVYYEKRRRRRSLSRWDIYNMLAQEAEMRGHGDGRSCVLRAICDAADTPIDKYQGLFNELFHTTFSPTSTKEELSHYTDNEYFGAQKLGIKYPGHCRRFFPECKTTILDMFTTHY